MSAEQYEVCRSEVELLEREGCDVFLAFRPASVPLPLLQRVKAVAGMTITWFSDDPVYFSTVYATVAPHYDLVLHTGGPDNLRIYSEALGLGNGVEFPFWTDQIEHPRADFAFEPSYDWLFYGNLHDRFRRDRVDYLRELGSRAAVFGKPPDARETVNHLGILTREGELRAIAGKCRFGLSFSQRLSSYAGTKFESVATRAVREFPMPSRLIQYLAIGLPVMSRDQSPYTKRMLPGVMHAETSRAAVRLSQEFDDSDWAHASNQASQLFEESFTAESRAAFLLELVSEFSWRRWSITDRSVAFAGKGSSHAADCSFESSTVDHGRAALNVRGSSASVPQRSFALIGKGWTNEQSVLSRIKRALHSSGHQVVDVNPFSYADRITDDVLGHFSGVLDVRAVLSGTKVDAIIAVGDDYLVRHAGDLPVIAMLDNSSTLSRRVARKAETYSALVVANEELRDNLSRLGYANVYHLPFILATTEVARPEPQMIPDTVRIAFAADRPSDVTDSAPWMRDSHTASALDFQLCSLDEEPHVVVIIPDLSGVAPRLPQVYAPMIEAEVPLHSLARFGNMPWAQSLPFLPEFGSFGEARMKIDLYRTIGALGKDYANAYSDSMAAFSFTDTIHGVLLRTTPNSNSVPQCERRATQ
ncbi:MULTISPECIES: hypothetical protein [unclassified Brevibacterium]|uniref:hypothetical protein n=1 Tax=unclassified Brevibacterium TaxID=2614124 RepID=UPI0010F68CE1|nr:hypothetical protein [Brevibacterium sp. 2SA]